MGDPTKRSAPGHVPPSGLKRGNQRIDWDAHRELVRRSNRARAVAVKLLIEEFPEEFDRLHRICGALQDPPVVPKPVRSKAEQVRTMEEELAGLQAQLDRMRGEG